MRLLLCLIVLPLLAGDLRLPDAAKQQNRVVLTQLLKSKSDPNAAQVDGTTALHWAARHDDVEAAKLLLGAGANARAANRYGVTPLSLACTNGSGPMVSLLLDAGADPNTTLPGGETALMTAARTGQLEPVRTLIARGANVSAQARAKDGQTGQTALMWAAAEGHTAVVDALLAANADWKLRLDSGFTALLFAAREGRIGVLQRLIQAGASPNDSVEIKPSPAPRPGRYPRAGVTALTLAATNAHYELASVLLDAGADPNAADCGYTALHVLSAVRKPGVGDNDPAPDGSGRLTSNDFVRKMVQKGANLNARMTKRVPFGLTAINTLGATPYFIAARHADAELMRLLASLGADPKITNDEGTTPLIAAAGLGTRSPGEDAGTEPEVLAAVQAALDLGADVNAVNLNGETAMHGAAYKNLPAVVELLAAKGAKIEVWNKKNKFGWTPLLIAQGFRFGNFKPSPVTVAAIEKLMLAAGVTPPPAPVVGAAKNSEYK
ncbi:MAG: ankyrin repeat domain-containing protein [Bryobacteraceae bacterium]|nr:ankyrin repeat domain-containing protein [Bryobacteraceae bacterium]